jgi:hypothetical protein
VAGIQRIKLITIFQACSGAQLRAQRLSAPSQRSHHPISPSTPYPSLTGIPTAMSYSPTRRHTPIGDHDVEAGEDDEEQANGHEDEEAEHLNHQRHQHHRCRTRPSPITTIKPAWRLQLYNLLECPKSSLAAVLVHVLAALITFSALVTSLETVPVFHSLPGGIWFGIETSLVALFTVEYVTQQTFWIWLPNR